MKIKIISQNFYPDNFRINDISYKLADLGHSVEVLTGLPDYATNQIPVAYRYGKKRSETINGVKIKRVSTLARRTGAISRMLNYASFPISSFFHSKFGKKPDADAFFVFATSPVFQILPGIVWKKRTNKPLIIYCLDLWPESLKAWGMGETNFIYKFVKKISTWMYNKGDIIAVSSEPFKNYLIEICGVDKEKIVYLPQYAEDLYSDMVGEYIENGVIDFLFAGNIGSVQNVDCILRAVSHIPKEKLFCVHIVGDGGELENCKNLTKALCLEDKVVFHGRFPLEKMRDFYKLTDCFLLTLTGGNFIGYTLPGKAQGYLSAGKPIAGTIDGAAHEMILTADCGEVVSAGDEVALSQIMIKIIDNFDVYREKGLNGRRFYEENYTQEKFMDMLLKILKVSE